MSLEFGECRLVNQFARVALIILLLPLAMAQAAADTLRGRVSAVADGDTLTLSSTGRQAVKIRLAQIDAPEHDQAFGEQSKQSLAELVLNKTVRVETETIDKYGRTVGTVFVGAVNANHEQVKRGMAWAYRQYMHDPYYLQLELEARQAKIGLWSDAKPPWEHRHHGKADTISKPVPNLVKTAAQPTDLACGSKHYCKEMSSCEEARYYLAHCGLSRLDGDHDGIPCERLCNPSQ